MSSLSSRIKEARIAAGLTQSELAKKIQMHQTTIGNLESGYQKTCTVIGSLSYALGVRALWLENGSGEMREPAWREISQDALGLLAIYKDLPPEKKVELLSFAQFLMVKIEAEKKSTDAHKAA